MNRPSSQSPDTSPLRFGLIGAGPWAGWVHAPALAAHPGTELVSVWARRPDAARRLADEHGATVADDPDAMFADVDAVAFAVPPDVQAPMAIRAAAAGKHLVLDKPIAGSLDQAQELADAVGAAGVASLVLLTKRYDPHITEWLATAGSTGGWATGSATWIGGALLGGPYSNSPWRHERGAVADVGPHSFDLLDAGIGPVADVLSASVGDHDVWHVVLAHENGARSAALLSLALPVEPTAVDVTLYGTAGRLSLPSESTPAAGCYAAMLTELTGMVAGGRTGHALDVRRGLHLQRLIDKAERLARA